MSFEHVRILNLLNSRLSIPRHEVPQPHIVTFASGSIPIATCHDTSCFPVKGQAVYSALVSGGVSVVLPVRLSPDLEILILASGDHPLVLCVERDRVHNSAVALHQSDEAPVACAPGK